ncbi:hypothetical protein LTR27_012326 [Elasticomyces elasticus]|nr:hypothetical protein LTR27_012326 [Elasticomyces elasticus]
MPNLRSHDALVMRQAAAIKTPRYLFRAWSPAPGDEDFGSLTISGRDVRFRNHAPLGIFAGHLTQAPTDVAISSWTQSIDHALARASALANCGDGEVLSILDTHKLVNENVVLHCVNALAKELPTARPQIDPEMQDDSELFGIRKVIKAHGYPTKLSRFYPALEQHIHHIASRLVPAYDVPRSWLDVYDPDQDFLDTTQALKLMRAIAEFKYGVHASAVGWDDESRRHMGLMYAGPLQKRGPQQAVLVEVGRIITPSKDQILLPHIILFNVSFHLWYLTQLRTKVSSSHRTAKMNIVSKLHIYSCSHETLIQIRQPHPTRSKTLTNTFCIIRPDHIDAPCEACRRKLMLKAKAAKQLRRYRDFVASAKAPKELDWVRQRCVEDVQQQYESVLVSSRSRQRSGTDGTASLERRIPRKPVPKAGSDLSSGLNNTATIHRELPTPTHNKSTQLVKSGQQTPARDRGHRHAVVIHNHLLEANGQESEVWFAEPTKRDTSLLPPPNVPAIQGIEQVPARKDDREFLPSEMRRKGRRMRL